MSKGPETKLTKEAIEAAFEVVGRKAAAKGVTAEIAVFGGSSLVLASNIRESSGDIDAVYDFKSRHALIEIVDEVARELALPLNWMNEAVRRVAPPPGEPQPPKDLFADYPRDTANGTGLRVFVAQPQYILAMKLLANRDPGPEGIDKTTTDRADALALMHATGINTEVDLFSLLGTFYPNIMGVVDKAGGALKERYRIKVTELVDAYASYKPVPQPSWNIGGGRQANDDRGR